VTESRIQVINSGQAERWPQQVDLTSTGTAWDGFLVERHQNRLDAPLEYFQLEIPAIALVTKGTTRCRWCARGHVREALWVPGTIVFMNAGYELTWFESSSCWEWLNIPIDTAKVASLLHCANPWSTDVLLDHEIRQDSQATALIHGMSSEIEAGCPAGRLYGESLSLALVAHLMSSYSKPRAVPGEAPAHGLSREQLRRVIDYIDDNLADDLCLNELGGLLGMSASHFCRTFKRAAGVTPHQFVIKKRVDKAKQLIATRRLSMLEISLEVGFASQSHFAEVFHKATGTSPVQFQHLC